MYIDIEAIVFTLLCISYVIGAVITESKLRSQLKHPIAVCVFYIFWPIILLIGWWYDDEI